MTIGSNRTYGRSPAAAAPAKEERVAAVWWLNFGYPVLVQEEVDGEMKEVEKFVSLPGGVALDTMKEHEIKGSIPYQQLLTAKNDLLKELLTEGANMAPGEEIILVDDVAKTGFQVRLRRVKEAAAPIPTSENPFRRPGR